jgi:hypothetical protein
LRSFNWWNTASNEKPLTGMEIDIAEGRIRAYSSNADIPGYCILIDASDDGSGNIPFMIGATKSPSFKINWDGSLFINDNTTTKVRAFWVDKDGNMRVNYNTTTKGAAFYLDSFGNLKINYDNDKKTAKFNISNRGAVAIGPDKFNIDENGNMWIAGKTLDTATFSIKNDGTVTMKKGSITLGEITKTDGSKVPAFYVDDNGNLTIGGDAFSVNASGSLTANQGYIGGWKITESSLESTPDENNSSAQKMELKSDGSIKIGSYTGGDDGETWSNAFEVTPYGIMKAANFELASGVVNTAMMMKGKMRIAPTGNAATAKRQATQLFVDGTSYFKNNIYLDSSAVFIAAKGIYDIPTYDSSRECYVYADGNKASTMGMVGFIQTMGDGSKIQYNGILFGGAGTVLWTEYNWIGKKDGTTTTYLNGNIHINATSDSGKIYFPHPNDVIVGSNSQTLAQYIASEFTGEKPNVNFVANSAKWADKARIAEKLIAEGYNLGSKTQPVYFVNGVPVLCNSYPSVPSLSGYATTQWVED